MLQVRKSDERGFANHGWLKSRHTFSFADYYDPKHMGFRSLRVINEDRIAGGSGFGSQSHRDMEIISYVINGALLHQDSMGITATIRPGEVQRMTAGNGIVHSEYNALSDEETHFLQIWIMPKTQGGNPGYGQKTFEKELNSQKLVLVLSEDAREGSIGIQQDADLYISRLNTNEEINFKVRKERGIWLQVIKGNVEVNDQEVEAGDAVSFESEELLKLKALDQTEFLLFDLV